MPLFNWDAPTAGEVVKQHFWVYWAVTGPLTLLTMTLVGLWMTVHHSESTMHEWNQLRGQRLKPNP